jgi:hypothetical protein
MLNTWVSRFVRSAVDVALVGCTEVQRLKVDVREAVSSAKLSVLWVRVMESLYGSKDD